MRANLDGRLPVCDGNRQVDAFTDEIRVPLIIGVDHNDTTGANHLWSGCRDDDVIAFLCAPANIAKQGFASYPLDLGFCNGCALYRIINVGSEILNDITPLEEVDENGL